MPPASLAGSAGQGKGQGKGPPAGSTGKTSGGRRGGFRQAGQQQKFAKLCQQTGAFWKSPGLCAPYLWPSGAARPKTNSDGLHDAST
jgi:hypothetical protein